MRTRAIVFKEYQAKVKEQQNILDLGDKMTAEDVTKAEAIEAEIVTLSAELDTLKKSAEIAKKNAERNAALASDVEVPVFGSGNPTPTPKMVIPATAVRSRVTSFKGATKQEAATKAYRFGMFCFAALAGSEKAINFCRENGISLKKQTEGDNTTGGFLVPTEFESDLIDLREEFGTFRRLAKNVTMTSDTKSRPRRTGGLTAFAVGEGEAASVSTKGWDRVLLTAKKAMVLARYSSELDEDSIIDVGNDLAEEIAYAFSVFEDDCGWIGDGTSTYMRIIGMKQAFLDVDATIANIKGLVVASGNAWDEFTLADFNKVKARLPRYARRRGTAAWHCSQAFYSGVMERLMLASGGVTAAELAAGRTQEYFMGHPVEISQSLPDADANSQIACYFGVLQLAAMFGDRRQTTIAMSTDLYFAEDELAIRGTERFDIKVHDVGDTSKAGPIVGLISAAS